MRSSVIIILFLSQQASAQLAGGVEYYHNFNRYSGTMMPVAHINNASQWHLESRYNYDGDNTFSLYAGKQLLLDKKYSITVLPMAGMLSGGMNGGSFGMNISMERGGFFYNVQSQYSFSWNNQTAQYMYSWSESGYQISKWLQGGLSVQQTLSYKEINAWQPGGFVAFCFQDVSIPVYVFRPFQDQQSYIIGMTWEWNRGNANKQTKKPATYVKSDL